MSDGDPVATMDAFEGVETGSVQRATLYVPTYEAIVSLGAAYAPATEIVTQAGFTMTTTKHVFLRAAKAVTMQADGHVWLQSTEGSTHAIAGDDAYLIAGTGMYVGGGGYIGFMAGFSTGLLDEDQDFTGTDPSPPDGFASSIDTAFLAADLTDQIFNKLVGAGNYIQYVIDAIHFPEYKSWKWWGKLLWQSASTLAPMGYWTYSRFTGGEFRSLNFFSEAGIVSGTPAFMSIHGLFSVNVRSLYTTILGLARVNMEGGWNSALDSVFGDTSVRTLSSVSMLSMWEGKIASRLGELGLYGEKVVLGGATPSGTQLPTMEASFNALQKIELEALAPGIAKVSIAGESMFGSKLGVKTMGLKMESGADTTLKAFSIAGGVYQVVATATSIVISGAGVPVVTISKAGVAFGPGAGQVQLTSAGANVAGGAFNLTTSSITALSGQIDLL